MKLWIDDVRPAPKGWTWAKTLQEASHLYFTNEIEEISFDHDLGGDETTRPLADLIECYATQGYKPPKWHVHSANPVGRERLKAALTNADRRYQEYR